MAPLIGVSTGFTEHGDYLGVAFSRPLEQLGAPSLIVPYLEDPGALIPHLDGLLLAGGRDLEPSLYGGQPHPTATSHSSLRDECELTLVRAAIDAGVPLLGICRGMQVINVALGGTLHPDHSELPPPADRHPGGDWDRWREVVSAHLAGRPGPEHPTHEVAIEPDSRLARIIGSALTVNSYHHQSLDRLGDGVAVAARAPDGVIEAIELRGASAQSIAVQWELQEEPDRRLFAAFVQAAAERASRLRTLARASG